ncbi:hypothetical protein OZZ92_09565 [Enterococcus sp. E5-100]|uniref:hypothetical protein n=1 Tax=Enterococcus sp. E5-100 TaxID=3002975 RepID=UPI002D7F6571|nr:hypothetical protein [Enterococcus sp. E5-100]MEB4736026.1 hypothetical protein [Enterococcus sp. E5-100]
MLDFQSKPNIFEEMSYEEAVKWLLRQAAIHYDGSDHDAHVLATESNAGFATPETVMQARGRWLRDYKLPQKYPNILDIPPGKYATKAGWGADNPDGIEDDSFVEMMVFADHDSRKLIVAFARYSGEIYIKMTHNSEPVEGYNSLRWRRVYTTSVLFEGELRKGQSVNLPDDTFRYQTLRIHYTDGDGDFVEEVKRQRYARITKANLWNGDAGVTFIEFELTIEARKITMSNGRALDISSGNVSNPAMSNNVKITKIEGVK